MTARLEYGTTAKIFHWLIVALLVDAIFDRLADAGHSSRHAPGAAMTFHISVGIDDSHSHRAAIRVAR